MSAFHKTFKIFSIQDGNINSYKEKVTLTLHNGSMRRKGYISITMTEYITEHSEAMPSSFNNMTLLYDYINRKQYKFDLQELANKYGELRNIKL